MSRFVDIFGRTPKARRSVAGTDNVLEQDVVEPRKLTETLRGLARRIAGLEGKVVPEPTEFEVDCPASGTIQLQHGFATPVRWSVVHWSPATVNVSSTTEASTMTQMHPFGWVYRGTVVGTLSNLVGDFSTGCTWRMKTVTPIIGVRFAYIQNASNTYTFRCRVWNSAGTLLASKDIDCLQYGIYEAIFDTPLTADYTGEDLTFGIYNVTTTRYIANNSTALTGGHWGRHVRLVAGNLWGSGNVRPTTAGTSERYHVEPILGEPIATVTTSVAQVKPAPVLCYTSNDNGILVLESRTQGRAVIRVEPSNYPVTK